MKIAINYNTIKSNSASFKSQIDILKELGYDVCIYTTEYNDLISQNNLLFINEDIIEQTKNNGILVYIDLPEELCKIVRNSKSISTSTYLVSSNGDFIKKIEDIHKNRKPSIEKIWNRNYSDENLSVEFPVMSQVDFLRSRNINPNNIALEYFKKKMTYGKYDLLIREYAKKLVALGLKSGDSIALCLPNTPETMLLMAAADDIGIIRNNIFPLSTADEIAYCINMMGSKYLFIMDSKYKDLEKIANKTTLTEAFLVSPFESNMLMDKVYKLKLKKGGLNPKESDFRKFEDFNKIVGKDFIREPYKKDSLSSIQYTSGTTGAPKACMLTDDGFNARVIQYDKINVGLDETMRFGQIIPSCGEAFGEFTMAIGTCNGVTNVLIPTFEPDKLLETIQKNKLQGMSLATVSWLQIVDNPEFKNFDMSNFRLVSIGAEGCPEKYSNMLDKAFERQGYKYKGTLGAGATELIVAATTNTHDIYEPGTSGFPLVGNNIKIVDINTGEELPYNHPGRVIYDVVNPSLGYMNKPLEKDDFGIDLGDYGYINERGMLTVLGRVKDLIAINNKVIAPAQLEEYVNKYPYVKYACVVAPENSDKKIRICYVANDNVGDIINKTDILNCLPEEYREYAEVFRIERIPQASSLKTDRKRLSGNIEDLVYKPLTYVKKNKKTRK